MERNLYDDKLEDFLKRKADQYKIYPSDKVWKGIYSALHTGRKWHILGGVLLLFVTLTLISLELSVTGHSNKIKNSVKESSATHPATTTISSIVKEKENARTVITTSPTSPEFISGTVASKAPITSPIIEQELRSNNLITFPASVALTTEQRAENNNIAIPKSLVLPEIEQKEKNINWLEEKAIMKLYTARKRHFNLRFYLSPSISYRSLQSSNINRYSQNGAVPVRGLKGLINQSPALGVELGAAFLLPVTNNLVLKTGLQVNYIRYAINAYKSSPEKTSITLSGTGYSSTTTITTYSTLRTYGTIPETIHNQYLQVSLPIGAEWKVAGNNRLQWNIAGSVQPTYLLMNSAYMLTSDFSNYTKEPSLVRRWNVNAGIETFISYKMGGLRWQIGPQFRYQLLSSYTDRYPIHEYLMEYGMKIGVSKTIR